jgi:hypothetical protein
VQPEAVTPRLVAGDDPHRRSELPRSLLALLFDQRHQFVRIASVDAIDADLIGNRRVQGDNPVAWLSSSATKSVASSSVSFAATVLLEVSMGGSRFGYRTSEP